MPREIAVVEFRLSNRGKIFGDARTIRGESGLAFVHDYPRMAGSRTPEPTILPNHEEIWRCEVVSNNWRKDTLEGAYQVRLLERLKTRYQRRTGDVMRVSFHALVTLESLPIVRACLEELIERIDVSHVQRVIPTRQLVDMGKPLGSPLVAETAELGVDDPALFAKRENALHLSRVILDVPTTVLSSAALLVAQCGQEGVYSLCGISIGELPPPDPMMLNEKRSRHRRLLRYWLNHAFYHNPQTMSPPFESTWRKILAKKPPA